MISFRATDDELAFVDVAREFAKNKIRKVARETEAQGKVCEVLMKETSELGFLALELPESLDGLELPLISQVQINKALSYGDLGVVQGFTGAGDAASLYRLLSDHHRIQAMHAEPFPTTALVDLTDTEKPWGNGVHVQAGESGYLLTGKTEPVRLAQDAEVVIVLAKDQDGVPFIIMLDDNNWTVQNGDYRLGLLASGIGAISFGTIEIPKENILAEGQEAEAIIKAVQCRNYILQAAKQNGLMEAALDYATEYTAGRKAFGKEIAKFQGVSFKIAKMAIETRIVNHLTWEAALQADKGSTSAYSLALRALHRAHKGVRFVTDSAVQLLGGHGFIQEFPVEKWMRDAQAQVALYGRERDYLAKRGQDILSSEAEVTVE